MKKLNFKELLEVFGKDETAEILRGKFVEEDSHNQYLRKTYLRKRDYILECMSGTWQDIRMGLLELEDGKRLAESDKRLARYSIQYLEAADKLPIFDNGIDESRLEQAREYPIENFIEGKIRRSGNRITAKCPFHEEKTPSFFIYTSDNHYHCYGCGKHGNNAIDFLMARANVEFIEAV